MTTSDSIVKRNIPVKDGLDVAKIRSDFPILDRRVHGKPLVYLDNAATSQKPRQVIDALVRYYETSNANIHRAIHCLGEESTVAYEETRASVASFINAASEECIVFTRNATEAINLVAYTWGKNNIRSGDEIVLTLLDHHSNFVPWQRLAQEQGATVRYVDITDDGTLDLENLESLINDRTRLVAVTQISNSLGTINPVKELTKAAHEQDALVLVDGAQSAPHLPIDVQDLDCDFFALSSHKMLGPTGVGALYGRRELLEAMVPFMGGGEMIRTVTTEGATWNQSPWKFEAGTPNIADVIAFSAAIDYLRQIGMDNVRAHEMELTEYALLKLQQMDGLTIYGTPEAENRGGVISFNFPDVHPHDVGTIMDRQGVAIRAGHHCNMPLMKRLGVSGTVRASFYIYNTPEEVDLLLEALNGVRPFFE